MNYNIKLMSACAFLTAAYKKFEYLNWLGFPRKQAIG
jgi:hypothetical protein